jgi:predicted HicB family RNase H-like nuclease
MGKEYTEAQKKASIKYMQEKTDDIRLRLPKGTKDRWKAAADRKGVSMTKYVQDAVEAAIDNE